jgi:hypothetical protein
VQTIEFAKTVGRVREWDFWEEVVGGIVTVGGYCKTQQDFRKRCLSELRAVVTSAKGRNRGCSDIPRAKTRPALDYETNRCKNLQRKRTAPLWYEELRDRSCGSELAHASW